MSLEAGHLGNSGRADLRGPPPHTALHSLTLKPDGTQGFQGALTDVTGSGVRDPVTHLSAIFFPRVQESPKPPICPAHQDQTLRGHWRRGRIHFWDKQ